MEKSVWEKLFETDPETAKAKVPTSGDKRPMQDPKIMNAQKRATGYYFRTGEQRPLQDFLDDEGLK